jgi:hypothetical protein
VIAVDVSPLMLDRLHDVRVELARARATRETCAATASATSGA